MTDTALQSDAYAALTSPTTLVIQRLLHGPIDRVWAYLTDGDLRRRWLADGAMTLEVGAPFELVWRNDELTTPPGARPPGMPEEHRMESCILECDPPRRLAFSFSRHGDVAFDLEPRGERTLLTLTHTRLPDRSTTLNVSAGWHMHLDVLADRLAGTEPPPFWDGWDRLKHAYDARVPG